MTQVNCGAVTGKYFLPLTLQIVMLLCFLYSPAIHALVSEEEIQSVVRAPNTVEIAIKIDQIVGIDQREENYKVVATLLLRYRDQTLAYDVNASDPPFRLFNSDGFLKFAQEKGAHWPYMVLDNQQGRKDASTQLITVRPDGGVRYIERFTATFQAPNFDFSSFPFDEQEFHIDVTSVLPVGMYVLEEMPGLSGLGDNLGEEAWAFSDVSTQVSRVTGVTGLKSSRFSLVFSAQRHLTYYVARIFIPLFIILLVSWFTFLLRDFLKRVDVGITTLLLFIAFNFAVSNDLPRLGYVTAMDAFMTGTFMITGAVLLVNVVFRRLQTSGHEQLVLRLDRYAIMGYWPAYVVGMSVAFLWL